MAKTFKSEALKSLHSATEGLYKVGAIDKQKMREFDQACCSEAAQEQADIEGKLTNRTEMPIKGA